MPREKPAYRDNYAFLRAEFNGKPVVSVSAVARWMGKDVRTVRKQLAEIITPAGISLVSLARYLS